MAYLNVEGSLEKGLSWELPYLKVIWQPSLPEGSSSKRLSLCLGASGEVEHFYKDLDHSILRLAAANSQQLFGKRRSIEDLALSYSGLLGRSQKGVLVKSKINPPDGARPTLVWDEEGEELPWPETWQGKEAKSIQVLSSLWVSGGRWGVTVSTSNVCIREPELVAPVKKFPVSKAQPN